MSNDNMREVRDDIMELTEKAPPDFDGISHFPGEWLLWLIAALLTGVLALPFYIINKFYPNRWCIAVVAVPQLFFVMVAAIAMGDLVGEMNRGMQETMAEMETMEDPVYIGCENCGVAPIEVADKADMDRIESPGDCLHCGAVLEWDWMIEPSDSEEE